MTSAVDIVNMALDQIGAQGNRVQGINPPVPANSVAAQVAARNYQMQVDAVFRSAHWNALRKQASLTLLRAAQGTPENADGSLPLPPQGWLYSYALPADCLKLRFVFPSTVSPTGGPPVMTNMQSAGLSTIDASLPFVPAVDEDANGNQVAVVLTNASQAVAVYTARIDNPDLWDASLRNAVIATLAAWFVNPLVRNKDLLNERVAMAQAMIERARVSDGNEGITPSDFIPDWIQARDDGGGWGWCGDGRAYMAGYDTMSLPSLSF